MLSLVGGVVTVGGVVVVVVLVVVFMVVVAPNHRARPPVATRSKPYHSFQRTCLRAVAARMVTLQASLFTTQADPLRAVARTTSV